jgi:hypothetical protein
VSDSRRPRVGPTIAFLALHVPLAVVARSSSMATAHALLVVGYGFLLAVTRRPAERIVEVAAYVVGAEVLWRMNHAAVFWETGKYAVTGLLLLAGSQFRGGRGNRMALVYFALLIPSTVFTLGALSLGDVKNQLSFNLSGPASLATCAWFFSRVRLARADLQRILLAILGPLVSVATITVIGSSRGGVQFGDVSNLAVTGGFGPNQVSAVLGLGVLASFILLIDVDVPARLRTVAGGLLLVMAMQSALTFSRGGLYGAAVSILLLVVPLIARSRDRVRVAMATLVLAGLAEAFVIPSLEARTGGEIDQRFRDLGTTGRKEIAQSELSLFASAPLLGVGPGGAQESRLEGRSIAAHTEYTRLLAEHGLLGLFAVLTMLSMAVMAVRRGAPGSARALSAALCAWALVFMGHAAMRLAAPAFTFGLAMADLNSMSLSLRQLRFGRKARTAAATVPAAARAATPSPRET